MSDKIWNGGTTNKSKEKAIREWNKMIRQSEDYLDGVDVETIDNIKERINTNMDKPCEISGGRPLNQYRKPEGSRVGTLDNRDE